jgi:hypothetical protein
MRTISSRTARHCLTNTQLSQEQIAKNSRGQHALSACKPHDRFIYAQKYGHKLILFCNATPCSSLMQVVAALSSCQQGVQFSKQCYNSRLQVVQAVTTAKCQLLLPALLQLPPGSSSIVPAGCWVGGEREGKASEL